MARNVWDEPINKNIPWDGNEETNNLPVRGSRVEEFLKGSLNSKIGVLFYDTTNNRYLAFADEDERDKYIADPTQTDLVLGTFDAPFNYTAEITLASKTYNAVFIGSSGHYIDFTFDVKNKQGASTGESVIVKYTFMRGSNKREVSEIKPFGSAVHFNIDKYLAEGTNTIIVSVTGQNTLAATSVAITYEVVNLQLNDMLDISKAYNLTSGTAHLEVPYSISGYGTKIVEWYIDGEMLDYVRAEDEIVESNTTRTKHITLSNLSQGVHSLQFRAYTTVNGELFYTSTLYRDIIVYTGVKSDMIIAIATSIPSEYGIIGRDGKVALYDMVQYVPYTLRFATYSPSNTSNVEVKVKVDNSVKATLNSNNGIENNVVIVPTTSGTKSVEITDGNTKYELEAEVAPTTMNIKEITNGLVMDFVASEKTNNSSDRDMWEYGDYSGTLTGFAWNNASGWVNNRLEMTAGSTFEINYAPLSNSPTVLGKTIEIEWSTKNVKDDNAVICDLRNNNGVGIVIYATKVSMTSADGVTIETEYKSDENVRIAFVINRSTGSTYQRMSFIYANGILSRGDKWALTDSYTSDTLLKFQATDGAEVSLKSIRIYDDALSSDNILNNYILYRDTVEEMMEVYDRNDVYEENRDIFSPSKMSSRLPVMIVTGDIPTLENTSDKDTQITVDIEYTNLQDPSRSFKMVGAAMRPQGTSSMGYPKKNFRIYTQKLDTTVVYDATGNVVADKLYSFKQGAQPVNCWCLKADYAESSGTHNTGIARLWNEALYNAQIDGEYKLRTEAQRIAAASGYEYDVRTTIDGFPILLFYRPSANDDVIFIGKYNFNNDKSTESVFGFKGIPNFDNTHMQCWEVLNNGNPLALFTTTENFDTMWSEAFESRYPDTKTPDITSLKAFAQWMSTVSQSNFATEKWMHMDVYKMAAYWVYLMRHAGADQFVKNAMFTSEDGEHFYYILYDNDTINGLINTGHLTIRPTDTRQTVDASGSYVFAGHDSRLWNMLEADEEFINIVAKVDNALYSAGISYDNTIHIFDEEQAYKWVEKVYNQDAIYKYISPYVDKGVDNLFMLQGKRDLHRRWWLAKRFAIYDAKYVSGQYKSLSVELKCINGTPAGQEFTVTAGYPIDYGYGINNLPRKFGVPLEIGESYTFSTSEVVNLGDPIRIYGAPNIAELDFSKMADRLAVVTISNVYEKALGTRLTKLIVGSPTTNNLQVNEISGLRQALMLDYLDVQGMQALTSLDLSAQLYFKTLKAHNSSIASVTFAKGAPVERLELPSSMRVLSLEQLPLLDSSNIVMENMANVQYMSIRNCPNVSDDFSFVYNWYFTKTAPDAQCSLIADNIIWENVDRKQFEHLANLKANGGTLDLKGKVSIPNATLTSIRQLKAIFGETAFYPDSDFYIEVPPVIEISASTSSIWEKESLQLEYELYPVLEGNVVFSIVNGRKGCSVNASTGLVTTTETALDTSVLTVRATFTSTDGKVIIRDDYDVEVKRRIYPTEISIVGAEDPYDSQTYTWNTVTDNINGDYVATWNLQGGFTNYFSITSSDNSKCILKIGGTAPDTTTGTLTLTIKRRFDNATVSSTTKALNHVVGWPENVAIVGDNNPINNLTYTWNQSNTTVTGDYYTEWALTGNITSYLSIASSDTMNCVLKIDRMPMEAIDGRITITVYKRYNDEVVATAYRTLSAYKAGVIITDWSNAPIQKALYDAGLVANATYTLKSEAEVITAAQLQPGTAQTTSVFYAQRTNIKSFDEFQYFTGVTKVLQCTFQGCNAMTSITLPNRVTELENYVFQGCSALTDITFSTSLLKLGSSTFAACSSLGTVTLPAGFTTIGSNTFIDCPSLESLFIPASTNTIGGNVFMNCGKLNIIVDANNQTFKSVEGVLFNKAGTKLIEYAKDVIQPEYEVPDGVTYVGNYAFYNRKNMTYIKFPSTLTRLGNDVISMCNNLKTLRFDCMTAPSLDNASVFGATDTAYTGRNTYSTGENKLYLTQLNATGFEEGLWLDPLQNASKCGFSIHGRLVINTNRTNATFGVSYTTEDGTAHSVTLTSGVSYLDDIKYGTSVTITPRQLTGYTWDSNSVSFTYSATSNSATLNAYVYPANATISGETNPVDNPTYTWTTTTANVDGEYTATWALSGDVTSYMSIASQNNESCTLSITEVPTEEITGTLTLSIKPKVGNTVTTAKTLKALLPGVVITSKRNAPIQTSLYNAGLVANEKYSLQSEVEKITSAQLQPGTSASTSIFYAQRSNITSFNEFQYFTSVTYLAERLFDSCSKLSSITLPQTVTEIRSNAFYSCNKLTLLNIPASVSNIHYNAFNGCHSVDLVVDVNNATYSDVNGVLYNKAKTTVIRCANDEARPSCTIQSGVTHIGDYAFYNCSKLNSVTIPEGVTSIGSFAFSSCANLHNPILPSTLTNLSGMNIFSYCSNITEVVIPDKVTSLGSNIFAYCSAITTATIPASVTSIDAFAFTGCTKMNTIVVNRVNAPSVNNSSFGNSTGSYTGCKSGVSNKLRVPINSTGYEAGYWLDPLQDASKCNFHIHGKITIASNKSNATFNIAYISEGNVNKTVTVGVGTFYINDVKYGTSMTVTPNALSGYTWEKASTTITYSGDATVTLNAYIYPTSVTISGDSEILGGKRNSYYASVAPSNIDIGISYNWTIEGSTNVSIESYSGNGCILKAEDVENNDNCKLICTVETTDGKIINSSISIAIKVYRNLITLVYGTASGSQYVLGTSYDVANILYMEKNGSKVTPVLRMSLSTSRTTTIKVALKTMAGAFKSCQKLISADFSEFDGSGYDSMDEAFWNCQSLTSINWGECKFPNMKSLRSAFESCPVITNIDLSPFNGAPITSLNETFSGCKAVTNIDLSPLSGAPISDITSAFYRCSLIENLDLSPLSGIVVSSLNKLCYGCTNLKSIDLTPLRNSEITSYQYVFDGAVNLGTIIAPWKKAPSMYGYSPFGGSTSSYTGYNTRSTGTNKLYVPADATGYDTGTWLDPLQNSEKCGFTLEKTL